MTRKPALSKSLPRFCVLLAAVNVALTSTTLAAQTAGESVVVDTPRPMAAVIREIAKRCRCAITYEDVKWGPDQVEPSPEGRRPDGTPMMIPRGVPFRFSIPSDLAQRSAADTVRSLRRVIQEYESSQNPGVFQLVRGAAAFHILPAHGAILDMPITLGETDAPAGVAVQRVLDEVIRVSGQRIGIWNEPWNVMSERIRIAASNGPAYEALSRVLAIVDPTLSWSLCYDINADRYSLDIYRSF